MKMKINVLQVRRIAERYVSLFSKLGLPRPGASDKDLADEAVCRLLVWHSRERLNFDVLETFPDTDFAHDLGGVMREDRLMSARSALAYHHSAGEVAL